MSETSLDDLRHETERELSRVVDRLNSMALAKAEAARADVQTCAEELIAEGRILGVPIPGDAVAPAPAPQGFGAVIAVLGRDCLAAASDDVELTPVHTALVALRRALP